MAHYLYKPHVQGPEFITTPDLLIYKLIRASMQGDELLFIPEAMNGVSTNPEVQCAIKDVNITPACFLVAAGGGCLVSLGAECVSNNNRMILIARAAWRLKYLQDHINKISLSITTKESGTTGQTLDDYPSFEAIINKMAPGFLDLPRGTMFSMTLPEQAQSLTIDQTVAIKLEDQDQNRQLSHRLSFIDFASVKNQGHDESRYAIGPTTEEVQHYI